MTRTFFSLGFLFFALISLFACSDSQGKSVQPVHTQLLEKPAQDLVNKPTLSNDTTVFYNFNGNPIEVIIQFPKDSTFKGSIVALPGWNYPNTGWCDETTLCEKALKMGYALILPEMGKSIYCDSVFPETRKDWLKYPTRAWLKDVMIPQIQSNFQLLDPTQNNYVMGLSTGARGAVLLALDLPEIFNACAALSGDYDQTRYTKDKLYNGYYGPFPEFPDRWIANDNAITSIKKLTVPVYLAHGQQDQIVPIEYSNQLFIALQENGNEKSVLNVNPTAGHDYNFWDSEVDAVLQFFNEQTRN